MKRTWRVHRAPHECLDAHQRWDRAFQLLLQWSRVNDADVVSRTSEPHRTQEGDDEDRCLCARLDQSPGPKPDH